MRNLRRLKVWVVFLLAAGLAVALSLALPRNVVAARDTAGKPPASAPAPAGPGYEDALANLKLRNIGPAIMGGRIDHFAVVENDPDTVFVGAASGGVWKTTNAGTTWEPVFDNEGVSTIGDLAIAPSDPSIVWVGTGEPNNRQSSSWGNGVYKSTDGGRTWKHMGLADTQHIGRVVIHPANPDVVYIAALGHLWGPNAERGVFKTADGGKTWSKVLFINDDTGVVDIAMDPQSPDTLYAAAYERRRTVWGFNGGGLDGGIYKTTDGGATWKKLAKGLPYENGGDVGRVGLCVYRRNPSIVYAVVQHAQGGVFRSEDKGETWTKMSDTNPRPSYYSTIAVDPNNDLRIWVLGAPMSFSEDGGKTFVTNRITRIHGDYHGIWIDPNDSNLMVVGTDGGIHWSRDAGRTWDYVNTVPLGQFYEVAADMRRPYWICGGLQDNGSWCGPSQALYTDGITNDDWFRVGGGDGFYNRVDPADASIVYTESQDGNVTRRDLRTTEARNIRPEPKEGEPPYRFQWNSPIEISAHDHNTIYYGGNFLFKSTDRGDSWTKISPDLTNAQDRNKLPILGKLPTRDMLSLNDGVEWWPCITTIGESPVTPAVIWVGTDDGNLQVTRDAGKTWTNVASRVPGVPKGTYISRVVASKYNEGTAYLAFDGHRGNDFHVYLLMTADYGQTWKPISRGLPENNGTLHVIREDPKNSNLLFAGTEYGAFISFDRGANWVPLKMNFPTVPVDDILIHPRDNDLILGTHGRSVWILDDIAPLEQLTPEVLNSDLHLFDIRPAVEWRIYGNKGNTGHKWFASPNPPYGALINFYLKNKLGEKDRVRVTILDKEGKTVREINCVSPEARAERPAGPPFGGGGGGFGAAFAQQPCEPKPGINRVNWDLRYAPPTEPTPEQRAAMAQGFFFGGGRGPLVEPGEYTVKVSLGNTEQTKTVRVEEDSRITLSDADRAARRDALMKLYDMARTASRGQRTITGLKSSLDAAMEAWKRPGGPKIPDNVQKAAEELSKKVNALTGKFTTPPQPMGNAGPPLEYTPPPLPQRIGRLMSSIEGYTAAPTAQQTEQIPGLAKELSDTMDQLRKLVDEDLANLNKLMNEAGIPHINVAAPAGPPRRGRG